MNDIDLLVIGAGPAGLGAAVEAGRCGVKVLVVDDQSRPGGQLIKQIHKFFGSNEHKAGTRGFDIGRELLEEARAMGVGIMLSTKALGIDEDLTVSLIQKETQMMFCRPKRIILATGGMEKPLSFPGCTLPGVLTAGAAQTLCNLDRVLPGREIVMVGAGNVGLIVAYQLLQAGARVAAVIEAGKRVSGYEVHSAKLKRAGVPVYTGYTVSEVRGTDHVESVELISLDDDWNPIAGSGLSIIADTVCISVGLSPNTRLARMCGCETVYNSSLGGFLPVVDENLETSRKGIYAAGDLTGIEEASIAMDEGRIAGISSALSLGCISCEDALNRSDIFKIRLKSLRKELIDTESGGKNYCADPPTSEVREICPGYPTDERIARKAVAVLECCQKIPCNPCVTACPFGAIIIDSEITDLPELLSDKCTGCGLCLSSCPGLAIFLLDYNYSGEKAALSFPYEFYPYPEPGTILPGVDRDGKIVADVEVIKVDLRKEWDRTAIITVLIEKEHIHRVRSIQSMETVESNRG